MKKFTGAESISDLKHSENPLTNRSTENVEEVQGSVINGLGKSIWHHGRLANSCIKSSVDSRTETKWKRTLKSVNCHNRYRMCNCSSGLWSIGIIVTFFFDNAAGEA